jgi:hypothetical protein
MDLAPSHAPADEWSWNHHLIHAQSARTSKARDNSEFSPSLTESIIHVEIEDKLFIHYLDEVFYIQYPFGHK